MRAPSNCKRPKGTHGKIPPFVWGAQFEHRCTYLAKGITFRGQLAKVQVSGSISDVWDASWQKWVDEVNESLSYSGYGANHDYSHGAQFLRGYRGYGATIGFNAKQRSYSMNANVEGRLILGEAELKLDLYAPDRDGWRALIEYGVEGIGDGKQEQMDFGYFRFKATLTAQAMLGASIMGTAGVEYKRTPDDLMLAKPTSAEPKGVIAAEAFAGGEAGGGVKGSLSGLIDFGKINELVMYIYHKLKDNNFGFLFFITEAAILVVVRTDKHAKNGKRSPSGSIRWAQKQAILRACRGLIMCWILPIKPNSPAS